MSKKESPTVDLVPRTSTQVKSFLEKHPEYDGRGVTICVLDSGVAVNQPGLSVTSTGLPKILDVVDSSGSGDVSLAPEIQKGAELQATSDARKKLLCNPEWVNPSGEFRTGHAFLGDLVQKSVVLPRHHKEQLKGVREENAELADALEGFLQERAIDVITWFDGENWCAAVDTEDSGDLRKAPALRQYRVAQESGFFGGDINAHFTVRVMDEGKTANFALGSSHGTHVAGIAAAYYEDHPERNGVAPGAQVVSVLIGDRRMGTMETHEALTHAIRAIKESGADIVTMSYGEDEIEGPGFFEQELSKLILEENIIFVCSGSNSGPRLCSGGRPSPDAPHLCVAASLDPELMGYGYGNPGKTEVHAEMSFNSRGPSTARRGAWNASVAAPGAAIAVQPSSYLRSSTFMNGTSMATPNTTGTVACLLSALKAQNIKYTAQSIVELMVNTASLESLADHLTPLDVGGGLIQLEAAYEQITRQPRADLYTLNPKTREGYWGLFFLDDAATTEGVAHTTLRLTPSWSERATPAEKAALALDLTLSSTAEWVTAPSNLHITNAQQLIMVHTDPTGLAAGQVHYAELQATDSEGYVRFRVPVTVVKPAKVAPATDTHSFQATVAAGAGSVDRYVEAPTWATHCTVRIKVTGSQGEGVVLDLIADQFRPMDREADPAVEQSYRACSQGQVFEESIRVTPGHSVQVVLIAGSRTSRGFVDVDVDVCFYSYHLEGLARAGVSSGGLSISASECPVGVSVVNAGPMARMTEPVLTFTQMDVSVAPTRAIVSKCSKERHADLYELEQHFSFETTATASTMLRVPMDIVSYGNGGFQWVVHVHTEGGERRVHTWGWGGLVHTATYSWKSLPAGRFCATVVYRHAKEGLLKRLEASPLILTRKIKSVTATLRPSRSSAFQGSGTFRNTRTFPQHSVSFYVDTLSSLPQDSAPGCVLHGKLEFSKSHSLPASYVVQSVKAATPPATPAKAPTMEEAVIRAQLAYGPTLEQLQALSAQHPEHLDIKLALLRKAPTEENARAIIDIVDQTAMALHFGVNATDAALRAEWTKKRDALVEALRVVDDKEALAKWEQSKPQPPAPLAKRLKELSWGKASQRRALIEGALKEDAKEALGPLAKQALERELRSLSSQTK